MTDKATQPLPDAYLFSNEWGEQELLLSCHGEQAQRLLEHGWTCSELFARAPSHHDLIEALRGLLDEIGKSACADTILDSAAAGKAFAVIAEAEGRRG